METEEERQLRRRKRIEQLKREKRRVEFVQKWGIVAVPVFAVVVVGLLIASAFSSGKDGEAGRDEGGTNAVAFGDTSKDQNSEMKDKDGGVVDIGGESGAGEEEADMEGGSSAGEGENDTGTLAVVRRKGNPMARLNLGLSEGGEDVPTSGTGDETMAENPEDSMLAGKVAFFEAHENDNTMEFDETIISQYGVLIDVEDGAVLAQKAARERMNPASMTKVLTLLVAAEHITEEDLDVTVPITIDITDYCFINECSITGYELDEEVSVRDLLYGTILPSGADSSLALAKYVSGSHEAFVDLMNEKVAELGLAETTHFTNCVGLYDEAHYTTAYDMAVILKAAADNDFCREILSARTYTTTFTEEHPEGLLISNWFLRRIEDRDTHGEVLCGKTGFVDESGSCAASLARGNNGKEYLCVTANSTSAWKCIADQVALYQNFIPE